MRITQSPSEGPTAFMRIAPVSLLTTMGIPTSRTTPQAATHGTCVTLLDIICHPGIMPHGQTLYTMNDNAIMTTLSLTIPTRFRKTDFSLPCDTCCTNIYQTFGILLYNKYHTPARSPYSRTNKKDPSLSCCKCTEWHRAGTKVAR